MRRVDSFAVDRWRALEAHVVLSTFAEHCKSDGTFVPRTAHGTTRWHASVQGADYEFLLNGPKFWDVRMQQGGGGAIDFVIHLTGGDFRSAAKLLVSAGL